MIFFVNDNNMNYSFRTSIFANLDLSISIEEGMAISTKPRLLLPLRGRCELLDDYRRKQS